MTQRRCRRNHVIAAPNIKPSGGCLACSWAYTWLQINPDDDMQAVADRHYMRIMRTRTP